VLPRGTKGITAWKMNKDLRGGGPRDQRSNDVRIHYMDADEREASRVVIYAARCIRAAACRTSIQIPTAITTTT